MTTKIFDSREPKTIRDKLSKSGWKQFTLISGDYTFRTWNNLEIKDNSLSVGITRKTISDLLTSITSGIFAKQLEAMNEYFDFKIILLEGKWERIPYNNKIITDWRIEPYSWDFCWNFLRTWQDRRFTIEMTTSSTHTVDRLESLYSYYQKPIHKGGLK